MNQSEEFSLETAACLWEAVLALRDQTSGDQAAKLLAAAIARSFETVGTAALRLIVVGWTSAVEKAWQEVSATYPLCFDWDFVPGWVIDNIDWSDAENPHRISKESDPIELLTPCVPPEPAGPQ
ncbi:MULTISPECIES: hypothetical protein [Sphingobium]|uniref:hypothetical protein n=1 Tax=Sphingobium TaxID=165695 RepID=UPI00076FF4F4|nr:MULTISPECIES: hypothetical protein [unclassified Sphingobium]AMK25784.1 hypothetical protein K426_24404 [Sphingobium sp. TKS]MEC6701400.1 hypothetical protein [Sphingobium sp. SJ10-10]PNQ04352.1 hypothetical protein A8G00_01825 [Sphingobium sp. SA916]